MIGASQKFIYTILKLSFFGIEVCVPLVSLLFVCNMIMTHNKKTSLHNKRDGQVISFKATI